MRVRIGAATVAALLGLTATVTMTASPAAGGYFDRWSFDHRPVGFPVVAEPALTFESAFVTHLRGFPEEIHGRATLAGVPDATTDAVIRLVFGEEIDGECVPEHETEVSSLQPEAPATRDGRSISFASPAAGRTTPFTCSELTLAAADDPDVVLDRLDGEHRGTGVADYVTNLRLHRISGQRVRAHRWTTLRIELHNKSARIPIDSVRITGFGKDVAMRKLALTTDLAPGATVTARLTVLLRADTPRRLNVRAMPRSQPAMARAAVRTVWVRPR